jgi:Na+/H+-dicarboxylate symporter
MKHVTDFGVSRISTMVRYFAIGTVAVIFALACSLVVFPTSIGASEANRELLSGVLDSVLKVVPSNLITPFVEANTLQLLLIAIVTGHILATLDAQVPEINAIIRQLFKLGLTVAQQACAFVPFFVGLLLCLKIWTHDIDVLISMWIPLLLAAVLSIVVLAITVLMLSMRFHMSPLVLARKLKGPFVSTLKTGALDFAGVDNLAESCKKQLGVNRSFAKAALPQGLFLFLPTSGIGFCVFVIYASHMYNMQIDQVWLVAAAVLSVVLAVATPPLAGANLLSFIMAFMYLGIPDSAILAVMVFDILFGELCIATDQAMLQLETVRQAELLGFLDEEVLRAS